MYHFGNKWGMADQAVQHNQAEWHRQGKQGGKAGFMADKVAKRELILW